MKKTTIFITVCALFITAVSISQTESEISKITKDYDLEKLAQLETEYTTASFAEKQVALQKAAIYGWEEFIELPNGGLAELIGVHENGNPKYITTTNREGAITTRANKVHSGGGAGLDLNGENMLLGIWEVGDVVLTHPLLGGRVTKIDAPASNTAPNVVDHATHVAGTMVGEAGPNGGATKGMAPMADCHAYTSSGDTGEMTAAAANGLLVSNHSYGFRITDLSLWQLGYYSSASRGADNVAYNAPYYLSVHSAGNDRNSGFNPGDGGYDYLNGDKCAKNNMVVAATFEVLNYSGPGSVNMSAFSSWGPTDDGRIKPDISAKGVNMFSSVGANSYGTLSGTSMAAPNTSGSLILLQQHYNDVNGTFMLSSTLRGLALHTADEAGTSPGPDYRFGWGLLNTERAAQVITDNGTASFIVEEELKIGEVYTTTVQADGVNDLMTSITWTDPAGFPLPTGVNDVDTPRLINDMDLRVSKDGGATFMPWILDVANPTNGATTGDNIVDNIEKIEINGASGEYIVQISNKGTLTNAKQMFSFITTGIDKEAFSVSSHNAILKSCSAAGSATFDIDLGFNDGFTDTVNFTVTDLPAGTTGAFAPASLSAEGTTALTVSGIGSLALGDYSFKVTGTGTSDAITIYLTLRITDDMGFVPVDLTSPPNNAGNRPIDLTFEWEEGNVFVAGYDFELSLDETFTNIVTTESVAVNTFDVTGLLNSTVYYWRVRAMNSCEDGPYSSTNKFTTRAPLGVDDLELEKTRVYPNPTTKMLNIETVSPMTDVKVLNMLGQTVLTQQSNANTVVLDVTSLPAGSYFVQIGFENRTQVVQLLKK